MKDRVTPIIYAFLAAAFYSINTPLSKLLLANVPSTFMAAFLYLGAGVGVGIMYIFHWRKEKKRERLGRTDLPYTIGMIVLDILAPIFLMLGIKYGTASNASLLGNFEIAATTLIALVVCSRKLKALIFQGFYDFQNHSFTSIFHSHFVTFSLCTTSGFLKNFLNFSQK